MEVSVASRLEPMNLDVEDVPWEVSLKGVCVHDVTLMPRGSRTHRSTQSIYLGRPRLLSS